MKTKLFFLLAMAFIPGTYAQISSTYAFAEGTTDSVIIRWDAFPDEVEIIGCLIYKRPQIEDLPFLLTEEMVVSEDSDFTFTDFGELNYHIPPKYFIKAVTVSDTIEFTSCWPFASINIEALDTETLNMELTVWNTDTCCMDVSFYVNDIFNTKLQYSNPYMTTINLALMSPGDEISFVFSYFWAEYERITLSYEYLLEQTETISVNSFHKADLLHQNFPNPFTTETQICFELPEQSFVSLDVFDCDGRLLKNLVNSLLFPGMHEVSFYSTGLSKGIYIYKLSTNKGVSVRKMIIK
ncbi:MAG: T9SS type A sorting domain-containing protein [Lentimicrobiaceae bacterium]|nr:T9SS type A sorting domain-containing protein [Lentimicrobiaceae bacterium]